MTSATVDMKTSNAPGAVVANAGSLPEMVYAAVGLARSGMLRRYAAPFAFQTRDLARSKALPRWATDRALEELTRRFVPDDVPRHSISHHAKGAELINVLARRLRAGSRLGEHLNLRKNRLFDASLAQSLTSDDTTLVATATTALASLRRASALGIPTILNSRIADFRYTAAVLEEEAALRPEWAFSLRLQAPDAAHKDALLEEFERATCVLALSSSHRDSHIASGLDPDKVITVLPGVDTELFTPRSRPHDGIFRVGFVGQVTQRKGIAYLLDAFAEINDSTSELLIVGNPPETMPESLLDLPRVRRLPAVARPALRDVFADIDVYVLPSLVEGLPLTALEAMASGKVVVATEFMRDVIVDGVSGFIVPVRDSSSIAQVLELLRKDPDRREAVGRTARKAVESLTWDAFGAGIARVVGSLTGSHRASPPEHAHALA